MKQFRYQVVRLWLLLALAVLCQYGEGVLCGRGMISGINTEDLEGDGFREQKLNEELLVQIRKLCPDPVQKRQADVIAATMLMGHFSPEKIYGEAPLLKRYKPRLWQEGQKSYQAVWGDLECFPVAATAVFYEDSWLAPRGSRGDRRHEGCDLFGEKDAPGIYPVVSITRGKVEQIGWLPLGGYRIGIRSPSGGYFYYAHLDSYGREFQEGDSVKAGQLLGYMGNTGYGPEGTRGEFATHLHMGIYVKTQNHSELSVNPYWVLRFLDG